MVIYFFNKDYLEYKLNLIIIACEFQDYESLKVNCISYYMALLMSLKSYYSIIDSHCS